MDDRELEARLATRLHARFDTTPVPSALAANVRQAMATPTRSVGSLGVVPRLRLPAMGMLAAAVVVATVAVIGAGLLASQVGPPPRVTPQPTSTVGPERQFIVLAPNLPQSDKAAATAVGDILDARLRALGYENFSGAIGNAFLFIVPADGPSDGATRRTLSSNAVVKLVPLPPADYGNGDAEARLGVPLPKAEPVLFGWDGIASAELGEDQQQQPTIVLTLTASGRAAFADYTTNHQRESFAVLIDDVVVMLPVINEPITDGKVEISGGGPNPSDPDRFRVAAAILVGGPLPEDWFGLFSPLTVSAEAATAAALALYPTATVEHVQLDARAVLDSWEAVWNVVIDGDLSNSCPMLPVGATACPPPEGALTVVVDGNTGQVLIVVPTDA